MKNFKNVILVAFKPKAIFEQLKDNQGAIWVVCLILLVATTLLRSVASIPATQKNLVKTFSTTEVRVETTESGNTSESGSRDEQQSPPPPEVQKQIEESAKNPVFLIGSIVFGSLGLAAGFFLSVFFLLFILRLLGSTAGFKVLASLIGLSSVPYIFREIIWTFYTIASGNLPKMDGLLSLIYDSSKSSAGIFGPDAPPVFISTALSRIDLFTIWSLIVMFFGLSVFIGISKRKSAIITAGYWTGAFLLMLVPALISAMLMPATVSNY